MTTIILRRLWPAAALPLAGCTASPVLWVGVALFLYGMVLGLYPED
jgi:hypothetical protein